MSLRYEPIGPVPEGTARVARAAFPRGTTWMRLRDELGVLYEDANFRPLFAVSGRTPRMYWPQSERCNGWDVHVRRCAKHSTRSRTSHPVGCINMLAPSGLSATTGTTMWQPSKKMDWETLADEVGTDGAALLE